MGAEYGLSPTMVSRKLQALGFIKRYIAQHGGSPSLGEIAAQLDTNLMRASAIVGQLAREGEIVRVRGARRGISLPDPAEAISEGDAVLQLRNLGWVIDHETHEALPPAVRNTRLPGRPALDHIPDIEVGEFRDGRHGKAGG